MDDQNNELQDFYEKCHKRLKPLWRFLSNLKDANEINAETIATLAKGEKISKKNYKQFIEFFKQTRFLKQKTKDNLKFVIETLNQKEIKKSEKKFLKLEKLKKRVEELPSGFLKNILMMKLARLSGNPGWLFKNVKKIMNSEAERDLFNFPHFSFLSVESLEKLAKKIENYIDEVRSSLKEKRFLLRSFVTKVKQLSGFQYGNFETEWSLIEMRKVLDKTYVGKNFGIFWYDLLEERATQKEIQNFLDQYIRNHSIDSLIENEFPLFLHFHPGSDEIRKKISEKIILNYKNGNSYEMYLAIKLLEKKVLKKWVGKKNKRLGSRAMFQIQRNFYRSEVNKPGQIFYSLYELFRLGDISDEYLWKALLYKSQKESL